MPPTIELRGALVIDEMQPQFAATIAANSDGFFPVAGESAFWLEVRPGIVVNRLLDDFVKACKPRRLKVVGCFTPRGGITTTVTCVHEAACGVAAVTARESH